MKLVPTNVKVVSSSLTECILVLVGTFSCVKIDERGPQQREFPNFDDNLRAKKAEQWDCGTLRARKVKATMY